MLSAKQGYHFYNGFGMTRSLTGDWTWDRPHSMPALHHKAIEEAELYNMNMDCSLKYNQKAKPCRCQTFNETTLLNIVESCNR